VTPFFDEFTGQYPRPKIDKDIADGHEGFVEFGGNLHDPHPGWDVILGRQEVVLGTGRLLDDNEGVNVRSAFDAVRVGYDKPKGRIDLLAAKPFEINPGAWDDVPNPGITLWGSYASNLRWSPRFMSDVYFLDYDAKSATYGNQSGREQRRMEDGISIASLASRPGQVLITTLRLGSSGLFRESLDPCMGCWFEHRMDASRSGVARAFRPADRCNPRRQRPTEYAGNLQRAISARSLFRSEVRTDRAGKSIVCPAPVSVPPVSERDRRVLLDLVLAREHERRALQL